MPGEPVRVFVGNAEAEDLALDVLNLLSSGEEVELVSTSERACLLADVVRRVLEEAGDAVEQAGGTVRFERRPGGRGRVVVTVRLRPRLR